jgi:hypothetical protein
MFSTKVQILSGNLNISYICDFRDRKIVNINKYLLTFKNSKNEILSIPITNKNIVKSKSGLHYLDFNFFNEINDMSFKLISITMDIVCVYFVDNNEEHYRINKLLIINKPISLTSFKAKHLRYLKNILM